VRHDAADAEQVSAHEDTTGVLIDEEIPDRGDQEARRHWWPHLEPSGTSF
jgi:hypothetical protein